MRIDPVLRKQLDVEAAEQGISLASWFKNLAREALKKKGIEPQG
jgi:predicted HicB family RNase H-like nuclease